MSHYPMFADLHHRPVLLIGAGKVAERKAEALLAAGAYIRVVAIELSPQFQHWIKHQQMVHVGTNFQPDLLQSVFLVVAATNQQSLNRQIFQAAEAAGKFCNSVDDPQSCSFIVPAVVDRNPLQVAVCSGGQAPVLARLIRQQIETLLPPYLGRSTALAGRWRQQVKDHLPNVSSRRQFWQRLFQNQLFDHYMACSDEVAAAKVLQQQLTQPTTFAGSVTLVGAGPGDPGLLTLHALQAIQAADVVLYDALVSPAILALIRKDAEKINVGKRAGAHHVQQQQTNQLLVALAQKGQQVVRLKGGDPFVFGRGGEECQQLAQAGIPFRVIPGITAALGATAYAGIPLTHRDYAQTVLLMTGYQQDPHPEMLWPLLQSDQTLVIYMGTLQAAYIQQQLYQHNYSMTTPVAIISHGTQAEQTVQQGLLSELPQLAQQAATPALIVVGEVVQLRQQLNWFQPKIMVAAIDHKQQSAKPVGTNR